jgi:acetyltransferase-like isoleucine patch superfamily enzyme
VVAQVVVLPMLLLYRLQAWLIGADRALEAASQWLSLLPGLSGQYVRRAFLQWVLAQCHPTVVVEFGTLFSQCGAILEENVYVGPRCLLGWVHLEPDVLLAGHVQIPSGGQTHYFHDPQRPIREQGGQRRQIRVGAGSWIGAGAIILADVGRGCVIGAGAVVTRPIPDYAVAVGVPARVVRFRSSEAQLVHRDPSGSGDRSPDQWAQPA